MKVRRIRIVCLLALLSLCAFVWSRHFQSPGSTEDEFGMGLLLASEEQLRGVPLAFTPYSGDELPSTVDLSSNMPPAGHQGRQGSCVGWAVAYALKSYQEKLEERRSYYQNGRLDARRVFSPAFIYNQINNGRDGGSYFLDAFNLLSNEGAATWADMPYDWRDHRKQPTDEVKKRAKRYKIDIWRQVNVRDVKEVKAHLHAGFPVVVGVLVDRPFRKLQRGEIWRSVGRPVYPHAMVVVGYDDIKNAFKLINSWGTGWADGGYCWVDYDHFRRQVNSGFVAKDARNGPGPDPPVDDRSQPHPDSSASITISNVFHNTYYPNRPDLGYFMRVEGSLYVPVGLGQRAQVAIHFFYGAAGGQKGWQVRSRDNRYMDTYGFAACGSQIYAIPGRGLRSTWTCWIPYNALDIPQGRWVTTSQGPVYQEALTYLVAEPTLFIDNFGVVSGQLLPFQMRR